MVEQDKKCIIPTHIDHQNTFTIDNTFGHAIIAWKIDPVSSMKQVVTHESTVPRPSERYSDTHSKRRGEHDTGSQYVRASIMHAVMFSLCSWRMRQER